MPKRHLHPGDSIYFCHACHKETRDTGRGEEQTGLCWNCYQINEIENLHLDEEHEAEFLNEHGECEECKTHFTPELLKHLPYYLGEKSYPTI